MAQVLHGRASTTETVRRAIQSSQTSIKSRGRLGSAPLTALVASTIRRPWLRGFGSVSIPSTDDSWFLTCSLTQCVH